MTAKQAVYLAIKQKRLNLNSLKEEHRSIQTRKVGTHTVQIRFRDTESWLTLEDFYSNYTNKLLKDLSDQLVSASKVLLPEELLKGLTSESYQVIISAAIKYAVVNQLVVDVQDYNDLVEKYNAVVVEKENGVTQLSKITKGSKKVQIESEGIKQAQAVREARSAKLEEEILSLEKLGIIPMSNVREKFNDDKL